MKTVFLILAIVTMSIASYADSSCANRKSGGLYDNTTASSDNRTHPSGTKK